MRCGESILEVLWRDLGRIGPIEELFPVPNLGMAHGWCGHAFATLRFCRTFDRPHPNGLRRRLEELLAVAEPWGRGLRWPWSSSGNNAETMPGWCNGSAGFVQLFALVHRVTGDSRFLEAAIGAAWNAWEGGSSNGSLCCGEAGRAYALLSLSRRLGGDPLWLSRARALGERAAVSILANEEQRLSLFKGRLGVALLAAELENPEAAASPFWKMKAGVSGALILAVLAGSCNGPVRHQVGARHTWTAPGVLRIAVLSDPKSLNPALYPLFPTPLISMFVLLLVGPLRLPGASNSRRAERGAYGRKWRRKQKRDDVALSDPAQHSLAGRRTTAM